MKKTSNEKCSSCGANLTFDIVKQSLYCQYCGETKTLSSFRSLNKYPLSSLNKSENLNTESKIMRCVNCGAQEVVDSQTISVACPFCGSYKLTDTDELPGIKPNGLLPFLFSKNQIEDEFRRWIKSKKFRPNKLKNTKISSFNGVYTPCWVYDTSVSTEFSGRFYNEKKDSDGDTYRSYFNVSGSRGDIFKDVAVNVGDKILEKDFNILKPFDFSKAVPYDSAYLLGFTASHYAINADSAFNTAKKYIEKRVSDFIIATQHADGCDSLNLNCTYHDSMYNYLLLPVWIMTYKYNDKEYRIMSNGQTGEIVGSAPRSIIKISLAIILDLLLCVGIGALTYVGIGIAAFVISLIVLLVIIFTN